MKKTTINVEDAVMERLKEEAARRKTTMTALIEAGIRRILAEGEARAPALVGHELPPLPSYDMGEPLVDVADREALYDVLDRERDERLYGSAVESRRQPQPGAPRRRALAVAEDVEAYDADGAPPSEQDEERDGH